MSCRVCVRARACGCACVCVQPGVAKVPLDELVDLAHGGVGGEGHEVLEQVGLLSVEQFGVVADVVRLVPE